MSKRETKFTKVDDRPLIPDPTADMFKRVTIEIRVDWIIVFVIALLFGILLGIAFS